VKFERAFGRGVLLTGALLYSASTYAQNDVSQLKQTAKQARSDGHLDREADLLCQAASLDPKGFQKRCDSARADANGKLAEFDADMAAAKAAIQRLDFASAKNVLAKITFGPQLSEAQRLLGIANAVQDKGGPVVLSQAALRQAQLMYDAGNFTAAMQAAQLVLLPALQPGARQIVSNIQIYRSTMAAADQLANAGKAQEAADKYRFALSIKSNGPGDPASGLQRMNALLTTQQKYAAAANAAHPNAAAKADGNDEKQLLLRAQKAERSGDINGALASYNAVLASDATQSEALAGVARLRALQSEKSQASEQKLAEGIRGFYGAHYQAAAATLSDYLGTDHSLYLGAAHFYLGASLTAEALMGEDASGTGTALNLQLSAAEQFRLARKAGYRPVTAMVSPRVLSAWAEATGEGKTR